MELDETKDEMADIQQNIAELEAELKEAIDEITQMWDETLDNLTTEEVKPRRTDVNVQLVALGWLPSWLISYNQGGLTRTTTIPAYSAAEPS